MQSIRALIFVAIFASGCSAWKNINAPTDDPKEMFILAETQRYARILNKKITAEVTDEVFMVTSSDGKEKVPAAGWYNGGHIKYWRKVVHEYDDRVLSGLAAHEVCHSQSYAHGALFQACITLLNGYTDPA